MIVTQGRLVYCASLLSIVMVVYIHARYVIEGGNSVP